MTMRFRDHTTKEKVVLTFDSMSCGSTIFFEIFIKCQVL